MMIKLVNGKDSLYIIEGECSKGHMYFVNTLHPATTFYAYGSKQYEPEHFVSTGYEFKSLEKAIEHCESFGFQIA